MAVGGRLVDAGNPVRLFAAGVIGFALASAFAGAAPSGNWLIAARAVQGVSAAAMIPASLAIVVDAFPPGERGRAMGLRASLASVFLALGPVIGGLLTQELSWRAIFWVNLPISAATLAVTWLARPDPKRARGGAAHLERTGVLLLVPGLAAVVLALMEAAIWGWGSSATLLLLLGGGALLGAFVIRELNAPEPLVDLRLLRNRALASDGSVVFLIQFALVGLVVFGAILDQKLLGLSPVLAGLALLPTALAILLVAPSAGRLYDRVGARRPLALGTAIAAAGLAWTGLFVSRLSYAWLVPATSRSGSASR